VGGSLTRLEIWLRARCSSSSTRYPAWGRRTFDRHHPRDPRHRGQTLCARAIVDQQRATALQTQQLEVRGTIAQGTTDLSVYFDSLAPQVETLGNIVVTQTPTGPVYLHDVAKLEDTFKTRGSIVRVNGQEGISLVW